MKSFNFKVIALKHYDYKDCLEGFYDKANGESMYITIEHDNPYQRNAIPVYYYSHHVGYISNGEDRRNAYLAIMQSGRSSLNGIITEVNRERKNLILTVECEKDIDLQCDDEHNEFEGWSFDDHTLRVSQDVCKLRTIIDTLRDAFAMQKEWNDEYELLLEFMENHFYLDISIESESKLRELAKRMDEGDTENWKSVATRIYKIFGHLSDDAVLDKKVAEIEQLAVSPEMDVLMNCYGKRATEAVKSIPRLFCAQFEENRKLAIAQLRYFALTNAKVQAIKTLLAMKVRLANETPPADDFEAFILSCFSKLKPYWNGKGSIEDFCREMIQCKFKITYRDKEFDLFSADESKKDSNMVTFVQFAGLMFHIGLLLGTVSEIAKQICLGERNANSCAHTMWRSTFSLSKFQKNGEKLRNFLSGWLL